MKFIIWTERYRDSFWMHVMFKLKRWSIVQICLFASFEIQNLDAVGKWNLDFRAVDWAGVVASYSESETLFGEHCLLNSV